MMMHYPGKAITDQYPSRMLCGKRYDNGQAFTSTSLNGVTTTCFNDTVLVPLATWVFLLMLLGLIAVATLSTKRRELEHTDKAPLHRLLYRRGSDYGSARWPGKWTKTATAFSILYSLLVLATLLMNILEIVRLYLADRGAGLLPFTLASLVLILVLLHLPISLSSPVRPALSFCVLSFFVLSLAFTSVELATLNMLQTIEPRAQTEYLDSDQVLDVSVIVALYALEVLVEAHRFFLVLRDSKGAKNAPPPSGALSKDAYLASLAHDPENTQPMVEPKNTA